MRDRQVKLEKENYFQYTWIPEKTAIVGNVVKVGSEPDWKIAEVYSPVLDDAKTIKGEML